MMIRPETKHYRPSVAFEQLATESTREAWRLWHDDGLIEAAADMYRHAAKMLDKAQELREWRSHTLDRRDTEATRADAPHWGDLR